MPEYKTIDEYINDQPEGTREALFSLKAYILEAVPDSVETFNYNIPAFSLVKNGKRDQQVMMAGYKKHVGLYPHPSVMETFADKLKDYKQGKGSVQFPIGAPLPGILIMEMVKYRKKLIDEG